MSIDQTLPLAPSASASDKGGMYSPEPSITGTGFGKDIVETAKSIMKELGGVSTALSGNFAELLQAQIQAQMELQTVSLVSNLERSKHETKMSAIRNIRVA